jgi:hypothetical protein
VQQRSAAIDPRLLGSGGFALDDEAGILKEFGVEGDEADEILGCVDEVCADADEESEGADEEAGEEGEDDGDALSLPCDHWLTCLHQPNSLSSRSK